MWHSDKCRLKRACADSLKLSLETQQGVTVTE